MSSSDTQRANRQRNSLVKQLTRHEPHTHSSSKQHKVVIEKIKQHENYSESNVGHINSSTHLTKKRNISLRDTRPATAIMARKPEQRTALNLSKNHVNKRDPRISTCRSNNNIQVKSPELHDSKKLNSLWLGTCRRINKKSDRWNFAISVRSCHA